MQSKLFYFYIVRCHDNSLYCGTTTDVKRRTEEHNGKNKKGAKYTMSRRPVLLVYTEQFSSINEALRREAQVKSWTKLKKELLVKAARESGNFIPIAT